MTPLCRMTLLVHTSADTCRNEQTAQISILTLYRWIVPGSCTTPLNLSFWQQLLTPMEHVWQAPHLIPGSMATRSPTSRYYLVYPTDGSLACRCESLSRLTRLQRLHQRTRAQGHMGVRWLQDRSLLSSKGSGLSCEHSNSANELIAEKPLI